jgi:hypothetical protein
MATDRGIQEALHREHGRLVRALQQTYMQARLHYWDAALADLIRAMERLHQEAIAVRQELRPLLVWPITRELYHYTSPAHLRQIQATGAILPQEEAHGTQPWICWFSTNAFEPNAPGTGGTPSYRLVVRPEAAPLRMVDILDFWIGAVLTMLHPWGDPELRAITQHPWYASTSPVCEAAWLRIDQWQGRAWVPAGTTPEAIHL